MMPLTKKQSARLVLLGWVTSPSTNPIDQRCYEAYLKLSPTELDAILSWPRQILARIRHYNGAVHVTDLSEFLSALPWGPHGAVFVTRWVIWGRTRIAVWANGRCVVWQYDNRCPVLCEQPAAEHEYQQQRADNRVREASYQEALEEAAEWAVTHDLQWGDWSPLPPAGAISDYDWCGGWRAGDVYYDTGQDGGTLRGPWGCVSAPGVRRRQARTVVVPECADEVIAPLRQSHRRSARAHSRLRLV